jgi:hypothetical protein
MVVLVAGTASPALAQFHTNEDERPTRSERAARAEARAEQQAEQQAEPQQTRARPERNVEMSRGSDASGGDFARPVRSRPSAVDLRPSRPVEQQALQTPGEPAQRRVTGDSVRDWRARERLADRPDSPALVEGRNARRGSIVEPAAGSASVQPRVLRPSRPEAPTERSGTGLVQPTRPLPGTFDPERRRRVTSTPELGAEPPAPASALTGVVRPQHSWRNDWHRDRRYDWRDLRSRHGSLFRLGFYDDPFGWNYFRYGIGWRLWPSYYRSSFWLNDPWMYRLPQSYGSYRWVRYHNDALLVNLYTGEVEDVVYDFFW